MGTLAEDKMAHILVAEDEDSVREFVTRALISMGHDVTEAKDGGEALERLQNNHFDLLLTDIVMPVMDGIALALKAASLKPKLRILMMSGYSAERQRAHNLDALIHQVLAKPFTLDQLRESVDQALNIN